MKTLAWLLASFVMLAACSGGNKKSNNEEAGVQPAENKPVKASADLSDHPGYAVYTTHCLPCHQSDGNGVPGMYPTLHDTKWVNGDKAELISIVIHGLDIGVEVNGETFSMPMAALPQLSDEEVADVLNYVRKRFGSVDGDVTAEEVKAVRAEG